MTYPAPADRGGVIAEYKGAYLAEKDCREDQHALRDPRDSMAWECRKLEAKPGEHAFSEIFPVP
jgi:hypothetical protein